MNAQNIGSVAVLGASGRLGRLVVQSLLANGLRVEALVHRRPLELKDSGLVAPDTDSGRTHCNWHGVGHWSPKFLSEDVFKLAFRELRKWLVVSRREKGSERTISKKRDQSSERLRTIGRRQRNGSRLTDVPTGLSHAVGRSSQAGLPRGSANTLLFS